MATVTVNFTDATSTTVCQYFAGPQDPSAYAFLGQLDTSDSRWSSFYELMSPETQAMLPQPN